MYRIDSHFNDLSPRVSKKAAYPVQVNLAVV